MYLLLTGATGLLGRYLLTELLLRHVPVAVLVRRQRHASAADRIETILARAERTLARALPRPMIIEGGLTKDGLNLSDTDRRWLGKNVSRILHSAASLKFVHDPETGEPWTSNFTATVNLLADCRELGIREFHYVSTAYVAGQRRGVVLETELDVGQSWGNVYEESKSLAEKELRASEHFESLTIYRPSIIVGDSRTGYTSTYHGFYAPLRVGYTSLPKMVAASSLPFRFLELFGLRGDEGKDLVPVDWVASAIATIVTTPHFHGRTYHLTSSQPVTVATMQDVFQQALQARWSGANRDASNRPQETWESFRQQLEVYRSYWRDDPRFDRTNTEQALPDLPCPLLDRPKLEMLAEAAIQDNFGWPAEPIVGARDDAFRFLSSLPIRPNPENRETVTIGLEMTGSGGTSWHISIVHGQVQESAVGLPEAGHLTVTYYLSARLFQQLCSGAISSEAAIRAGRVLIFSAAEWEVDKLTQWLDLVVRSHESRPGSPWLPAARQVRE